MRRSWDLAAIGVSALVALSACSRTSNYPAAAALATVHIQSFLVSTHLNAHGQQMTYRAPMANDQVIAADAHGTRTTADIDANGTATLHIPTGIYSVTNSLADACQPYRLKVRAGTEVTIKLACAAP
jgi:hypothetical protein